MFKLSRIQNYRVQFSLSRTNRRHWCYRHQDRGRYRHGGGCRSGRRQRHQHQKQQEHEETEETENSLHFATAPGTGGHFHQEPVSGHEHQRRDSDVDESHRGQSQGKCDESIRI